MKQGFTLLEMMITVSVVVIVFAIGFGVLASAQRSIQSREAVVQLTHVLGVASENARMGNEGSDWGVYLDYDDATRLLSGYTVFKGSSYATREVSADRAYGISAEARISSANLSGAAPSGGSDHEVVFSIFSGGTSQYGSIIITAIGEGRTVVITEYGDVVKEF